jgi:hypothetical protein
MRIPLRTVWVWYFCASCHSSMFIYPCRLREQFAHLSGGKITREVSECGRYLLYVEMHDPSILIWTLPFTDSEGLLHTQPRRKHLCSTSSEPFRNCHTTLLTISERKHWILIGIFIPAILLTGILIKASLSAKHPGSHDHSDDEADGVGKLPGKLIAFTYVHRLLNISIRR